jgi:hypothetical protein
MPKAYRSDVQAALKTEREMLHSAQMLAVMRAILIGIAGGLAIFLAGLRPPQGDTALFVVYWFFLAFYIYLVLLNARRLVGHFVEMRDALVNISNFKKALKSDDLL